MKTYTKEEIEAEVKRIFAPGEFVNKNDYEYGKPDVDVTVSSNEVRITVTKEYEAPGLSVKRLLELTKFFETMNIDDAERISESGCETCDYGSCYGFTLVVRPE